jgi:hypothetical protein
MTTYLILDQQQDFELLGAQSRSGETMLVPLAAVARCGVPASWSPDRILPLSKLISADRLGVEVRRRRDWLRDSYDELPACPFYKTHQIVDVFLEKQVLVEALEQLPGEKLFVDQTGAWISADGDNDEGLRIAASYMRGRPEFRAPVSEHMPRRRTELRLFARLARSAWQAWRQPSPGTARHGTGATLGYGAARYFETEGSTSITVGQLVLACLRRPFSGWSLAWHLLRHDRPILLARKSSTASLPFIEVLAELQARASLVHDVAAKLCGRWNGLEFFFTVNYGPIVEIAIARALRSAGVPVVTMQHALMGHDRWTASQYLDTWASDAKIVSSIVVADSMRSFERQTDCEHIPVTLPMLRRPLKKTAWGGRKILYVVTGFTRANTMYDNRRVNDSLYLELVSGKLAKLKERYEVLLRPHPYDSRQYGGAIATWLCATTGATLCTDPIDRVDAAILIDSPSTILADAMFAGRPIFVVNETAALQPRFEQMARLAHSLFDDVEALMGYLSATETVQVCRDQDSYAREFAAEYFGHDEGSLLDAVQQWLAVRNARTANLD